MKWLKQLVDGPTTTTGTVGFDPQPASNDASIPPVDPWNLDDYLVERIKETEETVAAAHAEQRKAHMASHAEDKRSYVFNCRRWGDFLSIEIGRLLPNNENVMQFQTVVQSINLGQTPSIIFHPGVEPSDTGIRRYMWDSTSSHHPSRPTRSPKDVYALYSVTFSPRSPMLSVRSIILPDTSWSDIGGGSRGENHVVGIHPQNEFHWSSASVFLPSEYWEKLGASTKGVLSGPVPALDDYIEFTNSRILIPTPTGLGTMVYELIMKAIAGSSEVLDDNPEHGTLLVDGASTNLLVRCPSTGKATLMRVPPYMRSAAEARAWTFGLTPEEFTPSEET